MEREGRAEGRAGREQGREEKPKFISCWDYKIRELSNDYDYYFYLLTRFIASHGHMDESKVEVRLKWPYYLGSSVLKFSVVGLLLLSCI